MTDLYLPGLRVATSQRQCEINSGRFQIHELVLDDAGNLSRFTATFEESCMKMWPVTRGCVHYER